MKAAFTRRRGSALQSKPAPTISTPHHYGRLWVSRRTPCSGHLLYKRELAEPAKDLDAGGMAKVCLRISRKHLRVLCRGKAA